MIKLKQLLFEDIDNNVYWHGSPSGNLKGGISGLHLGTKQAAIEALEARIGVRADGKNWDGTKEYGKTLLAGVKTLKKLRKSETGFNCFVPNDDFYLTDLSNEDLDKLDVKYSDGNKIPFTVKPNLEAFKIIGHMSNTRWTPHQDFKANGYMKAQMRKGNPKSGYYYTNVSEDEGSISIVVPNGSFLKKV